MAESLIDFIKHKSYNTIIMHERLHDIRDPFERIVQETLSAKEYEPHSFDVYPLVGRSSTGKSTIQGILQDWLSIRDGYDVALSSAGDTIRQHQRETTGKQERGHYQRQIGVDQKLDLENAKMIINQENAGKILIPEGKLLGFLTMKITLAAEKLQLPLPCNIHPILLVADDKIRYAREYEKLHTNNPIIDTTRALSIIQNKEHGEDRTFSTIYPELHMKDIYTSDFTYPNGEKIYQLEIPTSSHSAAFSARKIYDYIHNTTVTQPTP